MRFLRTVSTRRLLAVIAGFVSAIAAGAAIAVAAAGTGPVPPQKPLAQAVRDALAGPKIRGISARITFTNHLIDASNIQGADPILSGARGRLWLSSGHRLRLELQSDSGDAQVVVDNRSFWVYDPSSNTVYEGKLPASATSASKDKSTTQDQLPSIAQIQTDISKLAGHANLSGAIPGDVAGQAAYTVRVSPKHDGGLLGAGALAWDAIRGVPLRFAVYARNDSSPVLELKATDISFGAVSRSVFNVSPPSGAKVVKVDTGAAGKAADRSRHDHQARASQGRHGCRRGRQAPAVRPAGPAQAGRPATAFGDVAQLGRKPGRACRLRAEPRRNRRDRTAGGVGQDRSGPERRRRRRPSWAQPADRVDQRRDRPGARYRAGHDGALHPRGRRVHRRRLGSARGRRRRCTGAVMAR